ncbi:O-methyltransferase protein [Rutstroemia sp. NJR-2017a BVV2]|nr:O-methyltransferase protein [Rutstroemia sp. NJR-2017a BVV2]PQE21868.1 O-methyltransferase protein [Rutstroemia sp. NJR-2017a BVV2]
MSIFSCLRLNISTSLRICRPRNTILKKPIIRHVASVVGSYHEQTHAPSAGGPALSTSSLVKLAAKIAQETEKISSYMKENGLPEPSFNVDSAVGFPKLPDALQRAREEVIKATAELGELLTGAEQGLRCLAWDSLAVMSSRMNAEEITAQQFAITAGHLSLQYWYLPHKLTAVTAQSFPINGTSTFEEIAEKVGLDIINVRRLLRHAMTNRIFQEVKPGVIAHTAASKILAEDQAMADWVGFCVEDMWPASEKTIPALDQYPSASEPTQSGFCLANDTANIEPMFVTLGKSPLRAKRLGGAMASLTTGEGYELSHLINNYDWAALDAHHGTIVDLGGSHGFVCIELAKQFPNLKFVVQDLLKTIASAPQLDDSLAPRIKYMVHDFHTAQPTKHADVYLFRWIMHNHSNKYATNILNQLKPALKKGARVLINDYCLPESGKGYEGPEEKVMRTMDLVMLSLLNAQERGPRDWEELFRGAGGFRFLGVKRLMGSRMSLIEAVWEGEDV